MIGIGKLVGNTMNRNENFSKKPNTNVKMRNSYIDNTSVSYPIDVLVFNLSKLPT